MKIRERQSWRKKVTPTNGVRVRTGVVGEALVPVRTVDMEKQNLSWRSPAEIRS